MGTRSVIVVRGDRLARSDFTNRPVTAERTRRVNLGLALLPLPRRAMGMRDVIVVRGDRLASLDFTNRPVRADRTRVVNEDFAYRPGMRRTYPISVLPRHHPPVALRAEGSPVLPQTARALPLPRREPSAAMRDEQHTRCAVLHSCAAHG